MLEMEHGGADGREVERAVGERNGAAVGRAASERIRNAYNRLLAS
jgi:hypothetical protein